ncbi:NUDIX hydrolase [Streptomyces aidingensis]|uniref:ADP-ribose pyrophosphatase YjhB, NUDIX family n=1 Tax=Streptomyces aidingensis TaxID=910347 RepID=A0A1I1PNR7_9ACTN|nr:NUDIX hydrolase [Streptomyces aidingensis]SFD07630.1 ADP-ribose pyrophosphatase YjhB, NUDIX family [Streptomyces aidingensis]
MIVWLNGAHGAGKSTAGWELAGLLPDGILFEPERIGDLLRATLPRKLLEEVTHYQELPSWRWLVVETAAALYRETKGTIVVPMTVLRQDHRDELFGGLASRGLTVRHFLLHTEETILRERILRRQDFPADPAGNGRVRSWYLAQLPHYRKALDWLGEDAHTLDISALPPRPAAERTARAIGAGAGRCEIVRSPRPTGATVAAGMLLFDDSDRILLVDPTYKPGWEFPGGVVEPGEAPARAAVREVAEELGLRLPDGPPLLVVDWEPPCPPAFGGLRMLFDGGLLADERQAEVLLPGAELRGWRFVTEDEARELLSPGRFNRLHWALRARRLGRALNLEAGTPVGL